MFQRQGLTTEEQINKMKKALAGTDDKKSGNISATKKAISTGVFVLIILVLSAVLFNVLTIKQKGETPSIFGYRLYVVETASMEPTLPVGSIILAKKPKDASKLNKADIITFKSNDGKTITHRIIEVLNNDGKISYRTKGDNPINSPDKDPVAPENVNAVFVLKVPLT